VSTYTEKYADILACKHDWDDSVDNWICRRCDSSIFELTLIKALVELERERDEFREKLQVVVRELSTTRSNALHLIERVKSEIQWHESLIADAVVIRDMEGK
jgi:hypothetical protein